jgi:O-antigen/teichoic acid export membrane protein
VFQKITGLFRNLAIYGMGDVATSIVSLLLLPWFTRVLSKEEYGVWSLLLTVELVSKIVFRWGVDASFMRLYYDCEDDRARQRLASTILFFLLLLNGGCLAVALAAAPFLADWLFGVAGHTLTLQIVLVNTFIGGFFFIPFHVFRIRGKAAQFSALTFSRSASTVLLRVFLVLVVHMGVRGVVLADLVVTAALALVLVRWFAPLIRPVFSRRILREALDFGLPRIPHGIAQQVVGPGTDALFLRLFLPGAAAVGRLGPIGVYGIGASFGLALKYFLSAFEYAWAPFYFETMKEPDAKETFRSVTTYSLAVLVLLAAGLSAVSRDLVALMTAPPFHAGARVVPWVALAVVFQGAYLLTSIGLNITKHTGYYPVGTGLAAAVNIVANMLLIPRAGILGPAWASVISYAVLAAVSMWFSRRFYPIQYEWGRIGKLVLAGGASYVLAAFVLPGFRHAAAGVLARGAMVTLVFPALLALAGFFRPAELGRIRRLAAQLLRGRRKPAPQAAATAGAPRAGGDV